MNRLESVELIRLISIFAVIVIHTSPFLNEYPNNPINNLSLLGVLIQQASTFAVPFFFIISGYFWGRKVCDRSQIISVSSTQVKRLLKVFLFWSLIYITPYNLSSIFDYGWIGPFKVCYWNVKVLLTQPFYLVFHGTKGHLWFLASLIYAILISSFFVYKNKLKTLIIISITLYIFGLLENGYTNTPLGLKTSFDAKSGPTYSTIFFVAGYFLSKCKVSINWFYWGGGLFLTGFIIKAFEIYYLWTTYHSGLLEGYLIGTLPLGLGITIMSLSMHPILNKIKASYFSKYTLGIYLIHILFVDNFKPLESFFLNDFIWEISLPLIIFCLSLLTVYFIEKNRFTRQFV